MHRHNKVILISSYVESQVVQSDAQSEYSTAPLISGNAKPQEESFGAKAKRFWKEVKEEDRQRREERIQHVSSADATNITGHGENGPKSNAKDGKGDKRMGVAA